MDIHCSIFKVMFDLNAVGIATMNEWGPINERSGQRGREDTWLTLTLAAMQHAHTYYSMLVSDQNTGMDGWHGEGMRRTQSAAALAAAHIFVGFVGPASNRRHSERS